MIMTEYRCTKPWLYPEGTKPSAMQGHYCLGMEQLAAFLAECEGNTVFVQVWKQVPVQVAPLGGEGK